MLIAPHFVLPRQVGRQVAVGKTGCGTYPGEPRGVVCLLSLYWLLKYSSSSSLQISNFPLLFSSSNSLANLYGSLRKLVLIFSLFLLLLLILSTLRSLARLCLSSCHRSFRPTLSSGATFLQFQQFKFNPPLMDM